MRRVKKVARRIAAATAIGVSVLALTSAVASAERIGGPGRPSPQEVAAREAERLCRRLGGSFDAFVAGENVKFECRAIPGGLGYLEYEEFVDLCNRADPPAGGYDGVSTGEDFFCGTEAVASP